MTRRRWWPAAVAATVLLATVAGCSSPGTGARPAAKSSPQPTKVTVDALPIVDDAPLYLAQRDGLFARQGLRVSIRTVSQSTKAISQLRGGQADVAAGGNYVTWFKAQSQGEIDLRIVAEGALAAPGLDGVVVPPHSSITTPQALAHHTIAVNLPAPNVETLTLDSVLASDNVDVGTVRYATVPFPEIDSELQQGKVAAAWLVEPFLTEAEQSFGAVPVVDPTSGPTDGFPLDGYFTTAAFARAHPATVQAFQRAIEQAQAAAAHPQNVVDVLPRYIAVSKQTASLITLPSYPTAVQPRRLQYVADLMYRAGMLRSKLSVSTLLFRSRSS